MTLPSRAVRSTTVTAAAVSVIRVVPLALLEGSVARLAEYLGEISIVLERQITDLGAKPDGPMHYSPTGIAGNEITYEFQMRYTNR